MEDGKHFQFLLENVLIYDALVRLLREGKISNLAWGWWPLYYEELLDLLQVDDRRYMYVSFINVTHALEM